MTIFKGEEVTIKGTQLVVGDIAPEFELFTPELTRKKLSDYKEKIKVISIIPSVDTGVCDKQTRTFNQALSDLENVVVITISVDLPFAQGRWCGSAGIENVELLSDYYDYSFGEAYGVLIDEWHLLARAVLILDENNVIQYTEYLENIHEHPNYEAAQNVLQQLLK